MPSPAILAINWKQFHALSEGNEEFEVELLKIFFVETKTQLQLLAIAIAEGDLRKIEHLAHQIKGSSGNIGFLTISQQAGFLEQQARSRSQIPEMDFLTGMIQELTSIQIFLEQHSNHRFQTVSQDTYQTNLS
jgi:histidine phosphotransfer protein HptB